MFIILDAENQIIEQQEYYTPEVKPLLGINLILYKKEHDLFMHNNECFSNYEESHP